MSGPDGPRILGAALAQLLCSCNTARYPAAGAHYRAPDRRPWLQLFELTHKHAACLRPSARFLLSDSRKLLVRESKGSDCAGRNR